MSREKNKMVENAKRELKKKKKGQEQLYLKDIGKVEITTDNHQRVVTRGHCCHIYKKDIHINFWQKEKKKRQNERNWRVYLATSPIYSIKHRCNEQIKKEKKKEFFGIFIKSHYNATRTFYQTPPKKKVEKNT